MATATPDIDTDRLVAGFVHTLRRGGLEITISQSALFREALEIVGLANGLDVYWSGRSTLVTKQEHVAMYDAMFLAFFHHNTSGFRLRFDDVVQMLSDSFDGETDADDHGNDDEEPALQFSRSERLHDKDFGDFEDAELAEAERVMATLRVRPARRRSHRRRRARRGNIPDLRRTIRAAMRRAGEPIELATTKPGEKTRRLVLLLDISGSMERYARVLIRFAHTAVSGRGSVEVFALGTRLTRITRQLASRDPEVAVAAAAGVVEDWSGGTRLGDSIDTFVPSGVSEEWLAVRSSSCSPTGGTGETRKRCRHQWNASTVSLTRSSGSTRSRQARATNRPRRGWPPPSPMSTSSSRVTAFAR